MLKSDATFCHLFLKKFKCHTNINNTPPLLKHASSEKKVRYIHGLVSEVLKDLLPEFIECKLSNDIILDFPLAAGRRNAASSTSQVSQAMTESTESTADHREMIKRYMVIESRTKSSLAATRAFKCSICDFETRYESVCISHIEDCISTHNTVEMEQEKNDCETFFDDGSTSNTMGDDSRPPVRDMYWNYKCSEFFMDSMFAITSIYEKFGDGLGMLKVSKILLPVFHGLRHSNYSLSIHRFICRLLCDLTPKEGLKLTWERFSNKKGKPGCNIFKDRKMEHRIGVLKKLIGNLGPNFSAENVQQINNVVDIKEELIKSIRKSHGVDSRSGKHNPCSNSQDFHTLLKMLETTNAPMKIDGRTFTEH